VFYNIRQLNDKPNPVPCPVGLVVRWFGFVCGFGDMATIVFTLTSIMPSNFFVLLKLLARNLAVRQAGSLLTVSSTFH